MSEDRNYLTIYAHIQNLEPDLRGKLMFYLKKHSNYLNLIDYKIESPKQALMLCIEDHHNTSEGFEYWMKIFDEIGNPEPMKKNYYIFPCEQFS